MSECKIDMSMTQELLSAWRHKPYCYSALFGSFMPRLLVPTRKRVIILWRQGYSLKEIQDRLEEEGIDVTIRSLQRLCAKFEKLHTIQDLPRASKRRLLTPEMLSTMDENLRNDDELTARKMKAKLQEQCANFPDVSLATIKRYRVLMQLWATSPIFCLWTT